MMTLVLDGYNVIHAVPELARELDRGLEAARTALVRLCRDYRARRGDIERLYVVFDGDEAYARGPQADRAGIILAGEEVSATAGLPTDRGGVTVLFTRRQEEADERILQLVRADGGRSRFLIVSNDTYIFNNARVHGARIMPVQEFYAQLRPAKPSTPTRPGAADHPTLSGSDERRITDEYRKHLEGK